LLSKMTFGEQQEHLKRVTDAMFAAKPSHRRPTITPR
jgi:hypothetical protein